MIKKIIACAIIATIAFIIYKSEKADHINEERLMHNHVKFEGKIISCSSSNNHLYGLIKIAITHSNRATFKESRSAGTFPYRILNRYGEFYGYISPDLKAGQTIIVDSDKGSVRFYQG